MVTEDGADLLPEHRCRLVHLMVTNKIDVLDPGVVLALRVMKLSPYCREEGRFTQLSTAIDQATAVGLDQIPYFLVATVEDLCGDIPSSVGNVRVNGRIGETALEPDAETGIALLFSCKHEENDLIKHDDWPLPTETRNVTALRTRERAKVDQDEELRAKELHPLKLCAQTLVAVPEHQHVVLTGRRATNLGEWATATSRELHGDVWCT